MQQLDDQKRETERQIDLLNADYAEVMHFPLFIFSKHAESHMTTTSPLII